MVKLFPAPSGKSFSLQINWFRWSVPRQVVSKRANSYFLATLEGFPIPGFFHAHRLRRFYPQTGSLLSDIEKEATLAHQGSLTEDETASEDEGTEDDEEDLDQQEVDLVMEEFSGPLSDDLDTPFRSCDPECRICEGGTCSSDPRPELGAEQKQELARSGTREGPTDNPNDQLTTPTTCLHPKQPTYNPNTSSVTSTQGVDSWAAPQLWPPQQH
ncbi:hypothetical protein PAXINDRAFT_19930 [Paxillus involutus ATCC 200175]|uniref:Uncharacterized protein n=1 Tax=Paxillus involutus ATCC 200175 TaxID=664439 RepID=A0A0C9TFI0_PAXIN|nr:hypothetical protein PAXINDRAFT_19930 [Paxillus involutus ATCC 200175]